MKYRLAEGYEIDVEPSVISKRIACAIEHSELTYQQLEDKTGIPKSALQRYATGKTQKIPDGRIFSIAIATHTSPLYLFGQTDVMEEEPMRTVQRPLSIVFPDGTSCAPDRILEHIRDTDEKSKLVTDVLLKVPKLSMEDLHKVNDYMDLLLLRHVKEI